MRKVMMGLLAGLALGLVVQPRESLGEVDSVGESSGGSFHDFTGAAPTGGSPARTPEGAGQEPGAGTPPGTPVEPPGESGTREDEDLDLELGDSLPVGDLADGRPGPLGLAGVQGERDLRITPLIGAARDESLVASGPLAPVPTPPDLAPVTASFYPGTTASEPAVPPGPEVPAPSSRSTERELAEGILRSDLIGTTSPEQLEEMTRRIAELPLPLLEYLRDNGIRIRPCNGAVTDSVPRARAVENPMLGNVGYSTAAGVMLWRNFDGNPQVEPVVCSTLPGSGGVRPFARPQTLGHEIGHALDWTHPGGPASSRDQDFLNARALDDGAIQARDALLRVDYYAGEDRRGGRDRLSRPPSYDGDQTYTRALGEVYAESLAMYLAGDSRTWPNLYAYWDRHPLFRRPRT